MITLLFAGHYVTVTLANCNLDLLVLIKIQAEFLWQFLWQLQTTLCISIRLCFVTIFQTFKSLHHMDRVKRIWYLKPMRAAKVQANLRIRAVSPEPSLLTHISSESKGTFRQKARSLAPLNGWACPVKICHDGMLEDTNSLDGTRTFLMDFSAANFS